MIPYADIEFAIDRWKARVAGVAQPAQPELSGMVQAEVPVATAPETAAEFEPVPAAVEPAAMADYADGNVGEPVYAADDGQALPGDDAPGESVPEPPSADDEFKD